MSKVHTYPMWDHSDVDRWRENNADRQTQWDEFLRAMNSGDVVEIDESMWDYWLEVLPPVRWRYRAFAGGQFRQCEFGFAEGHDYITAFWRDGERYFCAQTKEMNDD